MKKNSPPVSVRAGRLEFLRVNGDKWDPRDVYHWLLTLSWPQFAAFILCGYFTVNLGFAVLYVLGGRCIAEMPRGSLSEAFFFSVETLATVGYGHMYPDTLYGHVVTTAEIMLGMFGMAAITGLIFVRFSRPTARVVFSRTLVVTAFDGQPALMLRVANLRDRSMAEAEFRIMLIRNENVREDETLRRFHDLRLQTSHMIIFPAALTIRHIIDEQSPLYGATPESLEKSDALFLASIVCIDTVIPAPVQSHQDYSWREVTFGHRFAEIYTEHGGGRLTVDYGRLHETEPAPGDFPR